MWILTIRSPANEPFDYILKAGKNLLGRKPDNDIVINDESASRNHAVIYCQTDQIVIDDLESLNGTFVNRERILKPTILKPEDQIRIGQHTAIVSQRSEKNSYGLVEALSGTRPLTRELLLESVDKHAVLLFEVSSRLSAIIDLGPALQEISTLMRVYMGADKCEVILADQFESLKALGFLTSIVYQAIQERSVVFIADPNSQDLQSESALSMNIRSVLCVPVLVGNEVSALIYVHKTDPTSRPFDQNDVQIAVAISHQATLAFQRARLMEQSRELEQLALTDSLTGLINRRQFLKMGELEFARARRHRHDLTLLLFDIDDFKSVNDSYGHRVGDQVLTIIAGRCLEQLRGIDMLGRLGGDEFTVLLAETNLEGGKVVAERLRRCVRKTPVYTDQEELAISISLGIAILTEDCPDLADLLKRADAALYAAKRAGKNQVAF
jgi:diguanylate cyclase (GGDEF)-like protein